MIEPFSQVYRVKEDILLILSTFSVIVEPLAALLKHLLSPLLLLFLMREWYSLSIQEALTCIFIGQQNCHLRVRNKLFQINLRLST